MRWLALSLMSFAACSGSNQEANTADGGAPRDSVALELDVTDTTAVDTASEDVSVATDAPRDGAEESGAPCDPPPRDCVGTTTHCGELITFDPSRGPGYDDYPILDETASNQYRSYARRDLVMLIKHAAGLVACRAASWPSGNGAPIGLGDMSEKSGAIPGTSKGEAAHPPGTHTGGYDIDAAYYQRTGSDNRLRPVCPHTSSTGADAYHCTGAPDNLDTRRTALFLGALLMSDRLRVVGVDGRIGPLVVDAMQTLCAEGTLPTAACDRRARIVYEETNTGGGFYLFHHHNVHVSLERAI